MLARTAGDAAQLSYAQFRTGYTYQQIRSMLWEESCAQRQAGKDFITVRRKSVLGRWHQIKRDMYAHYSSGTVQV